MRLIFIAVLIFTIRMIIRSGRVIDYMQSSEEAKKIPDNALKAINIWLEDFQENDAERK